MTPTKKVARKIFLVLATLLLTACAGMNRGCAAYNAETFGADWVVVQYKMDGSPINCWKLRAVSVTNEEHSDGIYWKDTTTNHLVHISGWYNRVQVIGGDYDVAAKLIGVDPQKCGNGKYPKD